MTIHKAVIPVAGFGTRMLPAAKAMPKEMLPVLDKPTIQYVMEEVVAAGLADVLLITSRDKRGIEDHFDHHHDLEQRLAEKGKASLLASLNGLIDRVRVHSVRQMEQKGLGHAVLQARDHVGNEPFLCLLGDTIFSGEPSPARQLIDAFNHYGTAVIGLEEVPPEKVSRYGIVGGQRVADGVMKLDALVEKPSLEKAPSHCAIAARYILTPAIFDCLEHTTPGAGGEIQLTDALKMLLAREPIHGVVLKARRHDIGNPVDWLKTNLIFAAADPSLWKEIAPLLKELLGR